MKISIVGIGYVGLSLAVLLAQHNEVVCIDIDVNKINLVNKKISPLKDEYIIDYLKNKKLNIIATTQGADHYKNSDFIIIATPTNYNTSTNSFDTSSIENVMKEIIKTNTNATIVIKSTIPEGFTESLSKKYKYDKIIFSPEFLRESKALYDNLYPSRIIVGVPQNNKLMLEKAESFVNLLKKGAIKENIATLFMNLNEAESVKLFANTYLALRIAFFNELDTYAISKNLKTKDIIEGICLDSRIGDFYNNPSFGYGGYCLPKDTKQLRSNFKSIPQNLISAICNANDTRKNFIAKDIIKTANSLSKSKSKTIGVYRLIMKSNSDNFRSSSIIDVMNILKQNQNINLIIYEPSIQTSTFDEIPIINDINYFKNHSNLIIANRIDENLIDVKNKIYTRDIFNRD